MHHASTVTTTFLRSLSRVSTNHQNRFFCSSANPATAGCTVQNVRRHLMATQRNKQPCKLHILPWEQLNASGKTAALQGFSCEHYATAARPIRRHATQPSRSEKIKLLRPSEIVKIFGTSTDVNAGNQLLQKIQSQRQNGTLEREITQPGISSEMIDLGLAYLRKNYPLDEDAAIRKRIEQEENAKEQVALAEIEKARNWAPQVSAAQDGVYGKSKVEEGVKLYNERMAKQEQERKEREQRELESTQIVFEYSFVAQGRQVMRRIDEVHVVQRGSRTIRTIKNTSYAPRNEDPEEQLQQLTEKSNTPGLIPAPNGMAIMQSRTERIEKENPQRSKWAKRAQLTDWDGVSEPPYMPWTKRWGLPTLFMLLTIGGALLFAQHYQPPPRSARLFPDVPPAASTMIALIALNIAGYLMWKKPPLWRFMNKHMLVHAAIPKPSQLVGNIFSHQRTGHLAFNMFTLWWMGSQLCDDIGRGKFLSVYISGGVFAAWFSLIQVLVTRNYMQASLGASGALCCVLACWLRLREGGRVDWVLWPGEWKPSFEPDQLLLILVLVDILGAIYFWRTGKGRIDHVCHLGGFLAGFGWAEWLRNERRLRLHERARRLI